MENRSATAPRVRRTQEEHQAALQHARYQTLRRGQELNDFANWATQYRAAMQQKFPPGPIEETIQNRRTKVEHAYTVANNWATHLAQLSPNRYRTDMESGALQAARAEYDEMMWDWY